MKMKKLAAAMGIALSLGVISQQAEAVIEFKADSRGDALLFPVFIGHAGFENYYTISNNTDAWMQGHLRFRGAAWSGELLDFDVILSPGDVFVFRLADVDGDGMWEVDQSLDINNFRYTGLVEAQDQDPGPYNSTQDRAGYLNLPTSTCVSEVDTNVKKWPCMDPKFALVPEPDAILTADVIDHHKHVGYIEFIGEAELNGMDDGEMMAVLLSAVPGLWEPYQTDMFSQRGTSAWKWSNAARQFAKYLPTITDLDQVWIGDRGLSDVPNALGGTGFVSVVGSEGKGVAFNAEALVNFRTNLTDHRVDNYRIASDGTNLDVIRQGMVIPSNLETASYREGTPVLDENSGQIQETSASLANRAVIVHHENGASSATGRSPVGDYVFGFQEEGRAGGLRFEGRHSYANTWGPTMGDGDDYNMTRFATGDGNVYSTKARDSVDGLVKDVNLRWTSGTGASRFGGNITGDNEDNEQDDFDATHGVGNSIAEVEEAIRVGGQHYTGYYFDGAGPGAAHSSVTPLKTWFFAWFPTKIFYGEDVIYYSQNTLDGYLTEVTRRLVGMAKSYSPQVWDIEENSGGSSTTTIGQCVSPAIGPECLTIVEGGSGNFGVGHELSYFDITAVKNAFSPEVADYTMGRLGLFPLNNDPVIDANQSNTQRFSWPALMYTFEMGEDGSLVHWRRLQR